MPANRPPLAQKEQRLPGQVSAVASRDQLLPRGEERKWVSS